MLPLASLSTGLSALDLLLGESLLESELPELEPESELEPELDPEAEPESDTCLDVASFSSLASSSS